MTIKEWKKSLKQASEKIVGIADESLNGKVFESSIEKEKALYERAEMIINWLQLGIKASVISVN